MSYLDDLARLSGKHAVVIGGAGGLGELSTLALARAGVSVTALDKDEDAVARLRGLAGAEGLSVNVLVGDAREEEALGQAIADGERLDILVNVVGGTFWSDLADLSPKGVDALVRLNFVSPVRAIQLATPRLREHGGSIINITSSEGHRGAPKIAVYAAMKAALTSLSASLAVELAPWNIRVNTIAPDIVETPALRRILGQEGVAPEIVGTRYRTTIPLRRGGTPDDWAGGLLFLASDLSSYLTGQALRLDGGSTTAAGFTNWESFGWFPFIPLEVAAQMPEIIERATSGVDAD